MNKYMEDQLEENRDDWLQHRINTLVTIGLVLAVALCLYVVVQVLSYGYANIGGFMMFRVVTGSMEPTIPVGSLLVTREVDIHAVEVGDIICFRTQVSEIWGKIVTHRVVNISWSEAGYLLLETKGDANLIPDKQPARGDRLIGRYVTNLNAMTSFLEFISNNMLMVVVLPLGLGMIVMYVGVVITTKKSVQNSAAEKEKDPDGAEN
jgi:signal peptidase I